MKCFIEEEDSDFSNLNVMKYFFLKNIFVNK